MPKQIVFISYAHSDQKWLNRFEKHLKPLLRGKRIDAWSDKRIPLGRKWHDTIQRSLADASAAVLFISPDFLASDYIANNELPVLLKKASDAGLKLFSIIVAPCAFEEAKFKYPDPQIGPQSISLSVFQAANGPDDTLSELSKPDGERILLQLARAVASLPPESATAAIETHLSERDRNHYGNLVGIAVTDCSLKHWKLLAHWASMTPPRWQAKWIDRLPRFHDAVARAIWPGALPELEIALQHLSISIENMIRVFQKHSQYGPSSKWYEGISFYKERGRPPRWFENPNYERDLALFEEWMKEYRRCLVEATKASNWFSDVVRRDLDPDFFLKQGYFTLEPGSAPPKYTVAEIDKLRP